MHAYSITRLRVLLQPLKIYSAMVNDDNPEEAEMWFPEYLIDTLSTN